MFGRFRHENCIDATIYTGILIYCICLGILREESHMEEIIPLLLLVILGGLCKIFRNRVVAPPVALAPLPPPPVVIAPPALVGPHQGLVLPTPTQATTINMDDATTPLLRARM